MTNLHCIKKTQTLPFVIFLILLAGCASTHANKDSGFRVERDFIVCLPKGKNCDSTNVLSASKEDLKSSGQSLEVSCERLIEKEIDESYRQKCKADVQQLSELLSLKWKDDLRAIDITKITYRDSEGGCVDGDGWGYCFVEGMATIQLEWIR